MNPIIVFLITNEAVLFAQDFIAQNPNLSPNMKQAYQKLIADINADVLGITIASQNPDPALPTNVVSANTQSQNPGAPVAFAATKEAL